MCRSISKDMHGFTNRPAELVDMNRVLHADLVILGMTPEQACAVTTHLFHRLPPTGAFRLNMAEPDVKALGQVGTKPAIPTWLVNITVGAELIEALKASSAGSITALGRQTSAQASAIMELCCEASCRERVGKAKLPNWYDEKQMTTSYADVVGNDHLLRLGGDTMVRNPRFAASTATAIGDHLTSSTCMTAWIKQLLPNSF